MNERVVSLPDKWPYNKNMIIFGATGSGKSYSVVRPYIFQSVRRRESFIVTDPKGELYEDMATWLINSGYTVKVLNLKNLNKTDSWDCLGDIPLDNVDTMITMTQSMVRIILRATKGYDGYKTYWDQQEANLLTGLILYELTERRKRGTPEWEAAVNAEKKRMAEHKLQTGSVSQIGTLGHLYEMLTNNELTQLINILREAISGVTDHPATASFNTFIHSEETGEGQKKDNKPVKAGMVKSNIVGGLSTDLQFLQGPELRRLLSDDSHNIDVVKPAKTQCAYFIIMDDQDHSKDFVGTLFYSILFQRLCNYADSLPEKHGLPITMVLDEFNNVGQIPDFASRLSTIRSRRISAVIILQSLSQIKNSDIYRDTWEEIMSDCSIKILLSTDDNETAKYWSDLLGQATIVDVSTRDRKNTYDPTPTIRDYSRTIKSMGRPLRQPSELMQMPVERIIVYTNNGPMELNRYGANHYPEYHQLHHIQIEQDFEMVRDMNPVFDEATQSVTTKRTTNVIGRISSDHSRKKIDQSQLQSANDLKAWVNSLKQN